jgi:hypothetical protein
VTVGHIPARRPEVIPGKEDTSVKRALCLFSLIFFCCPSAHAIDPGKAKGVLTMNEKKVALTEAYAHYHDNAEGLLDRPREIRIALTDRQIPQESLRGIAFLPVTELAREGRVTGLLLQFDPKDRSKVLVTLLAKPPQEGLTLMTLSLVDTAKPPLKGLVISKTRISGEVAHTEDRASGSEELPKLSYAVKFSAPLFQALPVTADMKGKQAQETPQIRVLRQKIAAMKKGDLEGIKTMSSEQANRRNAVMMEKMTEESVKAFAKEGADDLEKTLKSLKRVVVRGDRAVALCGDNTWFTFVKEGGQWKSGD